MVSYRHSNYGTQLQLYLAFLEYMGPRNKKLLLHCQEVKFNLLSFPLPLQLAEIQIPLQMQQPANTDAIINT